MVFTMFLNEQFNYYYLYCCFPLFKAQLIYLFTHCTYLVFDILYALFVHPLLHNYHRGPSSNLWPPFKLLQHILKPYLFILMAPISIQMSPVLFTGLYLHFDFPSLIQMSLVLFRFPHFYLEIPFRLDVPTYTQMSPILFR